MKVYVLTVENGDYSSKWTSVLSAFVDERAANEMVEKLSAAGHLADAAFKEKAAEMKARGVDWAAGGYQASRDRAEEIWKAELAQLGLPEDFADREATFSVEGVELVGVPS